MLASRARVRAGYHRSLCAGHGLPLPKAARLRRHLLAGGFIAPVMIATASDIEKSFGLMTAMRLPSRWMWMRSATSNTCGMLWRDEDDRQARALTSSIRSSTRAALLDAERRRRLVHDDDARAEGRGARHRHALPLAARQRLHRLVDVLDGQQAEVAEASRAPLAASPTRSSRRNTLPIDARLPQLAAEEHVVGDRQRRRQREVLVDGLDAGIARVDRRAEMHRPALRAGSRPLSGMTAPQSALISVDLPAPLSPMTAEDLVRRSSKSAWSSATTRP